MGSRLAIIGAALLWSTGGAAIKLSTLSAIQIAGGRAFFCGIALLILMPSARRRWNREILKTAFAYAAVTLLFVFANRLTTAANAIFIQNIAPVWVLLLSPALLGEKATRAEALSVPVSLVGCALFFVQDLEAGKIAGNLCAAGASVAYAILIMRYRKATHEEAMSATVAGALILAVVALPFSFPLPATASAADLLGVAYLGVIQQAAAAVLFVIGIRGVSALEGSLLILFEPLFAPVWAFLLVQERVGPYALLGGALILGATIVRDLARRR